MKKIMLVTFVFAAFLASCMWDGRKVKGNGHMITQSKPIGDINGVELHSSFDVILIEGSPSNVKIVAEENIIPHIELQVVNGNLNIDSEDNIWLKPKKKVKIYVTSPSFGRVENTGSGNITCETRISNDTKMRIDVSGSGELNLDIDAPEVSASVSGSGEIKLSGETQKFSGDISGSGEIRAMNLMAEEANIQVSGSGDADVYSSVKMSANISGSGDIRYKGGAQVVSSNISGSGSIKKVD